MAQVLPYLVLYGSAQPAYQLHKSHLFQKQENTSIYRGTLCIQNDTTDTDFSYIASQKMLFFRPRTQFT